MLTFALSKGRLADKILELLSSIGLSVVEISKDDRRLILESTDKNFRFFLAKPSDVPTFIEYGVADLGVVGKDTILEENRDITEILDLNFGKCKMCICMKEEIKDNYLEKIPLRVGTKYPNISKKYFDSINKNTTIIKLNGSVELAPLTGLSDVIVDIVESGRTLKENGLVVVKEIHNLSARLIVNNASIKTKYDEIYKVVSGLRSKVGE